MVIPSVSSMAPVHPVSQPQPANAARGASDGSNAFVRGLDDVQKSLDNADQMARQLATGELNDMHSYMAAAAKAGLAVQMTVAIRDRAVEAYQEIMRMQV